MQPPAIPRWVLNHFGSSPNNDAIIGDLNEKYQAEQSHFWYWRQVIVAILAGLWNEVTTHKLLAIRGIVNGWLALLFLMRLLEPFYLSLHRNEYIRIFYERIPVNLFAASAWSSYVGWVQPFDWVLVSLVCVVSACSGSVVALLHRKRSRAMLLAFFVSRCIAVFPLICFLLLGIIYTPQHVTALLKLIVANLLALIATVVPGAHLTKSPEPRLQRKAEG